MKCYKCGNEGPLKKGLCVDCYKEILYNKYTKRKKLPKTSFILNHIERNEKILNKLESSKLIYFIIISILAISFILFPKTIFEFFANGKKHYFLLLIFNILLFFGGIYTIIYFSSRDIYLTDKKIIGKWGLFKTKKFSIPLNLVESIDTYSFKGFELNTSEHHYFFDFVENGEKFKYVTIAQIKKLIDYADDEKELMIFSHSMQEKIENYQLEKENPNMMYCSCCKGLISKDSIYCVHCGKPIPENERSADIFMMTLCFFIFPIGLVLFLLNIGPYPKFAKQCLLCSISSMFLILVCTLSILSIL